jgi:hypothetical protein
MATWSQVTLLGQKHTMQAPFSTGRKLLIETRRLETNQKKKKKDNDRLGLLNAQKPLKIAEGF